MRQAAPAPTSPVAVAALHSLNLDLVFFGVQGMDDRTGFGISTIAALAEAGVIISDARLSPEAAAMLTERVGELLLAPLPTALGGVETL